MNNMELKKSSGDTKKSSSDEKIIIQGFSQKRDFVDHIFDLILPKDHDIKYPSEQEWKTFLSKILKKNV